MNVKRNVRQTWQRVAGPAERVSQTAPSPWAVFCALLGQHYGERTGTSGNFGCTPDSLYSSSWWPLWPYQQTMPRLLQCMTGLTMMCTLEPQYDGGKYKGMLKKHSRLLRNPLYNNVRPRKYPGRLCITLSHITTFNLVTYSIKNFLYHNQKHIWFFKYDFKRISPQIRDYSRTGQATAYTSDFYFLTRWPWEWNAIHINYLYFVLMFSFIVAFQSLLKQYHPTVGQQDSTIIIE